MIPTEQAPWQQYRPIRDHFIVGLYAYVRWVDNTVDEGNGLSLNQRKDFLQRQMKLVQGNPLKETDAMELMFSGLPWKSVNLNQELIKIPLATQSGERMTKPQVLEKIDQKEYNRLKSNAIAKISDNLETVRRLNIPLWQKFALTIYLFEALVKKQILLSRNRAFKGLKE